MKKNYSSTNQSLYRHVHKRLAFLFSFIAGLILVVLSICYLNMSEQALKKNYRLSFSSESNTVLANFREQRIISTAWLASISTNKTFFLAVYDNGQPFSYNKSHLSDEKQALSKEVLDSSLDALSSSSDFENREFSYPSGDILYYTNIARISTPNNPLYVVILSSTEALSHQLNKQRMFFLLIDIAGIFALFLFSWYYTGKLLQPILENQKKQNQFIAAASHELRTPLAVILSCLHANKKADDVERERLFSITETEGMRMSVLINDLLTLARADAQTWNINLSNTELDTLLLNSYETFLPLAKEAGLSMTITLPDASLPDCCCDKNQISQVLSILISNAISYGKRDGYIKLSLSYTKQIFSIEVEDNGIGISHEAKAHIFERFYREDSSRSKKDHFGLGLSIAKEIMDAHHGSITVKDTPGGGTTFLMKLLLQ